MPLGMPGWDAEGESLVMWASGGETEEEKIRVDILENEVMDTRIYFARICYSPDFVSLLPVG